MNRHYMIGFYMSVGTVIMMLFAGMLFMKIAGGIAISWFWVLSPIWITFLVVLFGLLFAVAKFHIDSWLENRRKKYIKGNLDEYDL